MKQFLLLLLTLALTTPARSQNLIEVIDRGTISKAQLQSDFSPLIQYGVEMKKITYLTEGIDGQPDTASGLFIFPDVHDRRYPMLVYQHGTIDGPDDVPSELEGGFELATVLAGMGYLVSAPDFLGMGESRGFHPYVDPVTEARAATDMLHAVREYSDTNDDIYYNDQLFLTGYSQGGHASMAAQRAIELDPNSEFTVTAGSHMSGPYSISDKMVEFTLGDDPYFFVGYLPNTALSLRETNPGVIDSLEQIFKPDFVPPMEQYYNGDIGLFTLNNILINQLTTDFGASIPKLMVQDSIVDALFNNPDHPFSAALATYDVDDWAPMVPTRMFYCEADDQVTFRNSTHADTLMNNNGAPDVQAINVDSDADHGGCVQPAVINTILFFGSYQNIEVIISNENIEALEEIVIGPQPALTELNLFNLSQRTSVELFDQLGRSVLQQDMSPGETSLDVSRMNPGMYLIRLEIAGQFLSRLVLISR